MLSSHHTWQLSGKYLPKSQQVIQMPSGGSQIVLNMFKMSVQSD